MWLKTHVRRQPISDIPFFESLMNLRLNHLASVLPREGEMPLAQIALAEAIYIATEPIVAQLLLDLYAVRFEDRGPYLDVPDDLANRPTVAALREKGLLIGAAHHP